MLEQLSNQSWTWTRDPQSNQKRLNFMLSWIKLFNALYVIRQGALFGELSVLGLNRCFVDWTTFFRVHQ